MIDFLSEKGRLLVLRVMRIGALLLIFYSSFNQFHNNIDMMAIMSVLIIILLGNDFAREKFFKKDRTIWYHLSFILSSFINAYFSYRVMGEGTLVYDIVLIVDLLIFDDEIPVFLLVINFIAYCIPCKINTNPEFKLTLDRIFLNYLSMFIVVYIMRGFFIEKVRASKLNEKLINANLKLKEYSDRIEELTVSKERTRIAQELHDSIGHSLVALSMNLEYAENIVDLKPEKAKEAINKAHFMSKDCLTKLREAVSVLKEESSIKSLRSEINKLFENFHSTEYKFNFMMDDEIEKESQNIKSCIYKTVMEGITNGIKHGNAEVFDIEIVKSCSSILFKISNNGLGCSDIKKSNGILGIEKRIADLGGRVEICSKNKAGFVIDASIPCGGKKL